MQTILHHKDTLLSQLKQSQVEQDNCLILEQRYHAPLIELLKRMASDLDDTSKVSIAA